jgi:polysaccharide biosynthesis protein PslH
MKALIVSHKPPYPSIDGGCLAMANLSEGLIEAGVEIGYMCISTAKHPFYPTYFNGKPHFTLLHQEFLQTEPNILGWIQSLQRKNSCYFTERFYSPTFSAEIIRKIDTFKPNWVILESVYSAVYLNDIKTHCSTKVILRSHNLEAKLWEEKLTRYSWLKRTLLKPVVNRLKQEEEHIFQKVDGILAISREEAHFSQKIAPHTPILYMPVGLNIKPSVCSMLSNSFFHLGAMDWEPNFTGIHWFMQHVWPSVYSRTENNFHLGGKGLDTQLFGIAGVTNHGQVDDAKQFMVTYGILVVPLFEASGLRIKLIEAGALGVPVIATPEAVGSLPYEDGEDILLARTAEEFIETMCELVKNSDLQRKLSTNIHAKTVQHFSSELIFNKAIGFLRNI